VTRNYYVRDFGDGPELVFRDDNVSTADTSDVRISNVISDVTGDMDGLTFYPFKDFTLTRDPSRVFSKVAYSFARGTVYEERPATAAAFNGERGGTASNSNVKTAAKAREEAVAALWTHHTEQDVIEGTILVPSSAANLINHGDRLQARFSHLTPEGYGSMSWFRVLELTRKPLLKAADKYELRLKLSPQEPAAPAAAIVNRVVGTSSEGGAYPVFANPVTIGNLLVYMCSDRGAANPGPPNTDPPFTWGDGSWTRFPTAETQLGEEWGADGVAAYYKIADATDQTCWIRSSNASFVCWELAGADPATASWTEVHVTELVDDPFAVGSLGSTDAGDVMLGMVSWYEEEAPPNAFLCTFPAGWTERLNAASYADTYYHHPHTWAGDAVDAHAGFELSVQRSFAIPEDVPYCGIGLRIPAL
jgi:hypothetical protein